MWMGLTGRDRKRQTHDFQTALAITVSLPLFGAEMLRVEVGQLRREMAEEAGRLQVAG